jgi:hypothetical protein
MDRQDWNDEERRAEMYARLAKIHARLAKIHARVAARLAAGAFVPTPVHNATSAIPSMAVDV